MSEAEHEKIPEVRLVIEDLTAALISTNFRMQKHGKTRVLAVDLGFEVSAGEGRTHNIVDQLTNHNAESTTHVLALIGPHKPLDKMEFPNEYVAHRVSLQITDSIVEIFPTAKVNQFKVEADGESFTWTFRVQALKGDADANDLVDAIEHDCEVTVSPAQGELPLEVADVSEET